MKMKHLLFSLFAISLIFTSCQREDSDSVDQDRIHVRYVLEYNADTDITSARAQFRFGHATGTILELVSPAEIKFNGDVLVWNNALAYYEKQYSGLVSTGSFEYKDVDGSVFTNTATVPSSIDFPASPGPISNSGSHELFWTGNALAADENVWVTISGNNTTGDGQTFATYTDGATSILFSQNKLEDLGTGTATMWMDRNHEVDAANATSAGGRVVSRYKADPAQNVSFTN